MSKERVLCVFAHADDESFAALGMLLKHKQAGDVIAFHAFTSVRDTALGLPKIAKYFDAQWKLFGYNDQELDYYSFKTQILKPIEDTIQEVQPTIVYTNFIQDLNRDHRIVAEAVHVACRPSKFKHPPEVRMGWIAGTTELGLRTFRPDIVEHIDYKTKKQLLKKWYLGELINGRAEVSKTEWFEVWPR